jgi:hypothetical protein
MVPDNTSEPSSPALAFTAEDEDIKRAEVDYRAREAELAGKIGNLEAEHPGLYERLILNGTLDKHLAEVEEHARAMLERLIGQMAQQEGITEDLKASDQLEWVQRMNSIRSRAEEIVQAGVINTL